MSPRARMRSPSASARSSRPGPCRAAPRRASPARSGEHGALARFRAFRPDDPFGLENTLLLLDRTKQYERVIREYDAARAGVEPVMGFCTPEQHESFLGEAPKFEKMIKREGIHFFKFWLNIGQETQLERFHARRHDPLKVWKLSPIDIKALTKWDEYTDARNKMFKHTDGDDVPWCVIRANDKRRSRINSIRHILSALDYEGKSRKKIGEIDQNIVLPAKDFDD